MNSHKFFLNVIAIVAPFQITHAATITVTNTNESGPNSLRQAITDALATSSDDTINFSVNGTITLTSPLPNITDVSTSGILTIDGTGQNITINGNDLVRPFYIENSGSLILKRLTVTHGYADSAGGGGLFNSLGSVSIIESTFSNNSAVGWGGGVLNRDNSSNTSLFSTLKIDRSLFVNNSTTAGWGGAISGGDKQSLTIVNSTFIGNSAPTYGGAIGMYNGGNAENPNTIRILNSTIAGNSSGLFTVFGKIYLGNTILSNNISYDCSNFNAEAIFYASAPNIGSCYVGTISISVDPKIGSLTDNGGPTQTIALQNDSPAIDAGDDTLCSGPDVTSLDQRRITRPQGSHCDIGAFEVVQIPPVTISSIIKFFDDGIVAKTLYGIGPGNSKNQRPKAVRNQLFAAGAYIAQDDISLACSQLSDTIKRIHVGGGIIRADKFVTGSDAGVLVNMITTMRANLSCS